MVTVGTVYLKTGNVARLTAYYTERIGLAVNREDTDGTVYLGAGETDLLALVPTPQGKRYQGTTGLYHFALLVPSRYELGKVLAHLIDTRTPIQGASDHLVSEALYLADPEGNGIEIYRDRDRSDWYNEQGEFTMGTLQLDAEGVLQTYAAGGGGAWDGLHTDTVMGHIHLHVASVPQAESFYTKMLGMDVMVNIGSASFLSYDGYHHHLGVNVWSGSLLPPEDALGLLKYDLHIGDETQVAALVEALEAANIPTTPDGDGYRVNDPSRNAVVLRP